MIAIMDTMRLLIWAMFVGALGAGAAVAGYLTATGVVEAPIPLVGVSSSIVLIASVATLVLAGFSACLITVADQFRQADE